MRKFLVFGALLAGWYAHGPAADAQAPRPNLVLILCDDLGYSDLGCYGGEIDTPNLDRLASEGVRLTQFYNNAKCTQTRAALLTGLYHHETNNLKLANNVTLAEVLGAAGYSTQMVGKWHLGTDDHAPPDRGFDRYFGFLGGAINFFTGKDFNTGDPADWQNLMRSGRDVFPVPDGFYSTDAFTDYAIKFLDEAAQEDKPFFLYLAHNSPHFPLHALPQDIEKYRGKYRMGWDAARQQRYQRQIKMGLIDPTGPLSPRDAIVPAWDDVSETQLDEQDLLMAVFAAMVHNLDRNVGRLLGHLDKLDARENTVVMFLSDNGGCPYDFDITPEVPPGPAQSLRTYNTPWANVSNSPFRLYKQWSHEGGISTPCIVRWPAGIPPSMNGTFQRQVGHLVDVMPTFVELSGAAYPQEFAGHTVRPQRGQSLVPVLKGEPRSQPTYYWEFSGHHAVRQGDWKLVAESGGAWELYNVVADRCELNNLAAHRQQHVQQLAQLYADWSRDTGARTHAECVQKGPSTQKR